MDVDRATDSCFERTSLSASSHDDRGIHADGDWGGRLRILHGRCVGHAELGLEVARHLVDVSRPGGLCRVIESLIESGVV